MKTHKENTILTFLLSILVLGISIPPRIPLPIYIPGRTFDLRLEDIIIVILLIGWLLYFTFNLRFYKTPLSRPIIMYVAIGIVTTGIAFIITPFNVYRAFFYHLKEIEYFVIFFLVATGIRTIKGLKIMCTTLLIAGGINALWVFIQYITGKSSQLLYITEPARVSNNLELLDRYGVGLIGEISPFSVCIFFTLISFLAYSYYWTITSHKDKLFLIVGIVFTACSLSAGEKIGVVLLGISMMVFFLLCNKKRVIKLQQLLILIVTLIVIVLNKITRIFPFVIRIFHIHSYMIRSDRTIRWEQLMQYGYKHFLTGVGKGSRYLVPGEVGGLEEAHNHYIKIFVESGIFGLLAFICLLITIGFMCYRVNRHSVFSVSKIISGATLCALIGLSVAAIIQDAFKPVLINELFWVFVGLTAAAYRIEKISFRIKSTISRKIEKE
ncbi:MAG: O-antigen ligase family protein [Candidatus Omnitrophica bacterium]|nr:O-antigen ligase family protein [Candidatus Omnitrophota bacterium]